MLAAFAMAAASCGGGSTTVPGDAIGPDGGGDATPVVVVDTSVAPAEVGVDEPVEVACTVTQDGVGIQAVADFAVSGTSDFARNGSQVAFHKAGTFTIACSATELGVTDDTPATVTVTDTRPASIDTTVDPAQVAAGTAANVTCTVKDPAGQPADLAVKVVVDPEATVAPGETAGAYTVTATKAGAYTVACQAVDGSLKDDTPATLTVVPGPLAKLLTTVTPDHVAAGGSATATCEATDAYGNAVPDVTTTLPPPEGVVVQSAAGKYEVSGTKAGAYKLQCEVADAPAGVEKVPATLTIEAGPAVSLELGLSPSKPGYKLTDVVEVTWKALDQYGNATAAKIGPVDVTPAGIATAGTSAIQFVFAAEGEATFHACIEDAPAVCDDVVAWCDGSAPVLVVTYPERGATLDGSRTVVVTGNVTDAAGGLAGLTINGSAVTVASDGTFQFPMTANQGINFIDVQAQDKAQNEVRTLRSFAYSTVWYPMDDPDLRKALVTEAIKAWADDTLFYSSDPNDTGTLSVILADVLAGLDLTKMLPNPLAAGITDIPGCNYSVYLYSLTFSKPAIAIKSVEGGLSLHAIIPNVKGNGLMDNSGGFCLIGDQDFTITADSIDLTTMISITTDPVTHSLRLAASGTTIALNGLDISLSGFLADLLIGLFQGTLVDMLTGEFEKQIASLVDDLNNTLADLFSKPIELPVDALLPGMNPFTLRIYLEARKAEFKAIGGAVDLDAMIRTDKLVERTILGSIGRAGCLADSPPAFAFDTTDPSKVQLGLAEDLAGELLYGLWNAKVLHLHVTAADLAGLGVDLSQYGIGALDLTTAPLLPPVLTDCATADGSLEAQLGDFYAEASFDFGGMPVDMHFYMFLKVPATLGVANDPEKGQVVSITVGKPTYVDVEMVSVNAEWVGQEDVLANLLVTGIIPLAFDKLAAEPITFAIPAFNLKSLGGESLPLPDKDLLIVPNALDVIDGYVQIKANLATQAPATGP
jgi:hypothetical protein